MLYRLYRGTSVSNFLINSEYNNQKIFINNIITFTSLYPFTDLEYAHGLGFKPVVRVWIESSQGEWYPLASVQVFDGISFDMIEFIGFVGVDNDNIYIRIQNESGSSATKRIFIRAYLDV